LTAAAAKVLQRRHLKVCQPALCNSWVSGFDPEFSTPALDWIYDAPGR